LWNEIAQKLGGRWSGRFLRNEYRHVLLARGVRTRDDYRDVSRAGRGVRVRAPERVEIWPAFEEFEARTRQAGRFSSLQQTETVAALLEQLPTALYDHVLVDEAQDLHASQWRLLRAITAVGPNDLFIAGDAFQRIYGDTVSLRSLGIETRGRSMRLRRNYRTTHQIVSWALGIVGDETVVDLDELGADLTGYHSVRHGPTPQFRAFADRAAELLGLAESIAQWLDDGHTEDDIVVVERTKSGLEEIVAALTCAGVSTGRMGRNGRIAGMVNVTTMHRVKGLEYPCVAVTGLSAQSVPPAGAVCPETDDPQQHAADSQTEKALIYVAATRARDELLISWNGSPTELIASDLADAIEPKAERAST
jgi:superfamily I DNA/RNA helicase